MLIFSTSFLKRWQQSLPEHVYIPVRDDSSSDTEEQKADHLPMRRARGRSVVNVLFLAILWLSTAALSGWLFPALVGRWFSSQSEPEPRQFYPEIPSKSYVFGENPAFAQEYSVESNLAWDSLMPPGHGRVMIPNPWEYGLEQSGQPTHPDVDEYGVSVFHQLHCLGVLRLGWHALQADLDASIQPKPIHLGRRAAVHCFDFLRQSLMCAADTTIEPIRRFGPQGQILQAHGWGVEHVCRDWDGVWDWTVRWHAESNRTGIL
ncbi:MAG: hypothetical protein MMC33_007376 [Icmadophila ericetorum]|nr:hypothetical protein [Icmadophila ericetorum]